MKILIVFVSVLLLRSSCNFDGGKKVTGDGSLRTEQRNVGTFEDIEVRGGMDVFLQNGATHNVRVEADGNLLTYIETNTNDGSLRIGSREGYNLQPRAGIKIYVIAPHFSDVEVHGSGDIVTQTKINNPNKLSAQIYGSGDIKLDLDAPETDAGISGSGTITLAGNTRTLDVAIRGSGDVHGFDLMSEATKVNISGSGNAQVFASKELEVEINGAGNTEYKGNPTLRQTIRGSGDIRRVQ